MNHNESKHPVRRRSLRAAIARIIVAAGVLVGIVGIGVAAGAPGPVTNAPDGQRGPKPDLETPRPPVRSVDATLASRLAVFRRARGRADELPAGSLRGPVRNLGVNEGLARRVAREASDGVFVVPTQDGACITAVRGGVACAGDVDIVAGNLITSQMCVPGLANGRLRVLGVLPDGVSEATVTRRDGTTNALELDDNAYVVENPNAEPGKTPVAVTWIADGARSSIAVPLPADLPADCSAEPRNAE
jgi:hypothetical protein